MRNPLNSVRRDGLGRSDLKLLYRFDDYVLDIDRRELRCGEALVTIEPQVFDLLTRLVSNRHRLVSKEDLLASVSSSDLRSGTASKVRVGPVQRPSLRSSRIAQPAAQTISL